MKSKIAVGIAAAVLSANFGAAFAADMPLKAPAAPIAFSWSGFYVGGFVGGAVADGNAYSTEPTNATFGSAYNNTRIPNSYGLTNSVIAGGTAGWNYQPVSSNWVFGVEGEAGYLRLSRTIQDINAVNLGFAYPDSLDSTRIGDWYGVVAGRLGYASGKLLIYGKGGVAFVNKSYGFNDNCSVAPCGLGILNINRSTTQTTWAAGGGIEYALTSNWSIKGEYLYLATRETFTVSGTGVGFGGAAFTDSNSHTDPGVHTAKIGINYRFGGPVVAKY